MSTYALGWRVFRDHFGRDVPADRRRFGFVVGVVTAVAAFVVLVVVGLVAPWPDLQGPAAWIGAALLATGPGAFAVALVPLRPRTADGARLYWSGSQMAAPDHVERYFRARTAPTIDPRDRDDVLRDAEAVRAGVLPEVYRGLVVVAATALAVAGVALLGLPARIVVWVALITAVRTVMNVIRLGRVERARALAATLPDVPAAPERPPGRRRSPNGSKIQLPGD
ncbi:hypothetical protein EDF24_1135 [Curtobacterium sp. PhB130]|uniref:hypothetical protein n=1 Tax=Curtobacterium sp. PhB130 TaxID=2485178 RepID=UPI000F4CB83B|nr:hypothetical protein [Curtobacterium sp. PhB130]ROS78359.1 hypothetical protein EDF24_1135 [Curtobacterium sp. PhB130]